MAGIPVAFIGHMFYTDLTIGGGPVYPPPGGGGGGSPPGIWGGANQPFPTPPIANVPPIYNPNPPGWGLRPEHPIFYPPGIWGPPGPWPTPPIANVPPIFNPNPPGWGLRPEHPIFYPPGIWGPPGPWPTPPIANVPGLPPMGPDFPGRPPDGQPTPPEGVGGNWEWGFNFAQGWHPVYIPGDKPQPIPPPGGGTPDAPHPEHPIVNP